MARAYPWLKAVAGPALLALLTSGCGGSTENTSSSAGGAAGSGGSNITGGTGGSGGGQLGDTFAYDYTTHEEACPPCEATIYGQFYPTGVPTESTTPTILLTLSWGFAGTRAMGVYSNYLYLALYGPAPGSLPASYTLNASGATTPGTGSLSLKLDGFSALCSAAAGIATLTRYDAVGGKIEGTYRASSVTEDVGSAYTCPPSLPESAFSVTREPDG